MRQQPPPQLEQLRRVLEAGSIDQDTYDAAVAAMPAQPSGTGAIAQGQDAIAVGPAGVGVKGNNYSEINTGVIIQHGTRPGASKEDLRRGYLARTLTQADQLPLFAGDTANTQQVRLSSVHTALLTQRSERESTRDRARIGSTPDIGARRLSALEVLNAEKKLVLRGDPGSGKSTLASFVALSMAGELLGQSGPNRATLTTPLPREETDQEDPKPQQWDHGPWLPVHVVLRDLASQLPTNDTRVNAQEVWEFIFSRLREGALDAYAPHLEEALHHRGGLVLLDGLDEVPDALNPAYRSNRRCRTSPRHSPSAASSSPAAPTPISVRTGSWMVLPRDTCCPSRPVRSMDSSTSGMRTWSSCID